MTNELTLDDLLVTKPVPVTVGGKTIYIKRLSALDDLAYSAALQQQREALDIAAKATSNGDPQQAGLRFAALMVKHHVCNSQGRLIFEGKTTEDIAATVEAGMLTDLYNKVLQHKKPLTLEDAEKNS